jgi:glycosyltransferase involved in cell wall biosynthesis
LRVGFVVYGPVDQVNGGYIYDRLVVEQLRELGDEVSIISLEPGARDVPELRTGALDVLVADALCFRDLPTIFRLAPAGLRRVLLIHHLTAWEHPPGAVRAELLALEGAMIAAADVCVATSRATADRLYVEGLARRVSVAEPGADRLPRPATGGQEPSGALLRLLYVGNILRRKRVLELCATFAGLPASNAELLLVGDELEVDYAAEVRALIASTGEAARIRSLGAQPAAGVAEQLGLADVLVLPSELEGYGMVLSEALWSGVPVIAARVGAAEQLVALTGAGLLFDPGDAAGLGATLTAFVADASLRARLRRAAWRAAERLPRWRDTALALRAAFGT